MVSSINQLLNGEDGISNSAGGRVIRMLIADPDPLARRGIKAILGDEVGVQVVGKVIDQDGLWEALRRCQADSLLIDVALLTGDVQKTILMMRSTCEDLRIVVMGTTHDSGQVVTLLRNGVASYLPKAGNLGDFRKMLRQALFGANPLSSQVSSQILSHLLQNPELPTDDTDGDFELTPREEQVLRGLMQGLRNREIAVSLGVTDRTVKAHVSSILRKMNVSDRTQAVVKALKRDDRQ